MGGALDRAVLLWINGWSEAVAPFFLLFSEGLKWPLVRIFLFLVIAGYMLGSRLGRKAMLLSLLAIPLANEITDQFKKAMSHPRPFQVVDEVILRVGWSDSFGTASAHSANMMALGVTMTLVTGKWGIPWLLVALFTGMSRVYVGAHYPSQVLLGWACGAFAAFLVVNTWRAFTKMREGSAGATTRRS
jgi:undecaprenyl-diphosphatase